MDTSIYRELQAAAERAYPFADGPAWQTLSRMEDDLDALLPPGLHRRFRRLGDQCNVAAAEHGESCVRRGLRCGLMPMADAQRPGRGRERFSVRLTTPGRETR